MNTSTLDIVLYVITGIFIAAQIVFLIFTIRRSFNIYDSNEFYKIDNPKITVHFVRFCVVLDENFNAVDAVAFIRNDDKKKIEYVMSHKNFVEKFAAVYPNKTEEKK